MARDVLIAFARTGMSTSDIKTRDEVRVLVERLAELPMLPEKPSPELIRSVVEQLEHEFMVRLGPAHIITGTGHRPWLDGRRHEINFKYWRRYNDLLRVQLGFPKSVVDGIDKVSDKILDLAGDPAEDGAWSRRGLVVGHVQSGKTANYVALINKAADAGYKLIILIAGVHSNLRSQTQERIDEGFVGRDSDQLLGRNTNATWLGVGNIDQSFSAVAYTSRAYDFTKPRADGLGIPIGSLSQPAIFVIKKNKSILTNLIEWLRSTSSAGDVLTMPILVIDDEADNASINTATNPGLPNTINSLIRRLLASSTRNTYIGYTATPFANIFVDPESDDELHKEDLFPRDFIVGLDAPSNYVGAADYFLDEKDSGPNLSVLLEDAEKWLPVKHKIDVEVDELPESLEEAINCFLLSKAIRILRGQGTKHHSMLVNVSRFTRVQGRVASLIAIQVQRVSEAIANRHRLAEAAALRDPIMRSLHESWLRHYSSTTGESWGDIQKHLHQASASVHVVEVNARSGPGALDYRKYAEIGLNVIAVGGNSLSRGFTLEGLTISYFLRNTQMYDTLLQMGRWFGYRDGYKDLCRLFIKDEAFDWYAYIASASHELRDEIAKMERYGLRPIDFGLAVRSHPGSLLVTARNKMRTARQIARKVGLAERLVESSLIVARGAAVDENWRRCESFITRLDKSDLSRMPFREQPNPKASIVFGNVPQEQILEFIRGFVLPPGNPEMATAPIIDYATRRGFEHWDVLVASNMRADEEQTLLIGSLQIGLQTRSATLRGSGLHSALSVSKNKRRVASRGQEAAGLTSDQRKSVEAKWRADNGEASIPDLQYRKVRERPLLMVHLLDMRVQQAEPGNERAERHAAYGISFPGLREGQVEQKVVYTANMIAFRETFGDPDAEGDDDDDYDSE
ncbi:MAG: Z1 domain-containing protein [Lysobacteraceae bacterium]